MIASSRPKHRPKPHILSPEGLAARTKGLEKRVRQIRAQADGRARELAPAINAIVRDGYVTPSEISAELVARGIANPGGDGWTPNAVYRVLKRLANLRLTAPPSVGPYGQNRYSSRPRSGHDVEASRRAIKNHADAFALRKRPTIDALQKQGFTTYGALATELNRRGVAPQRSRSWNDASVRNLIQRLRDMARRDQMAPVRRP